MVFVSNIFCLNEDSVLHEPASRVKKVLIFGAGDTEENVNMWSHYWEKRSDEEQLNYRWTAVNVNCLNNTPANNYFGCINIDFNVIEQLDYNLTNNEYDLIFFDYSTYKFVKWTFNFLFVLKEKLPIDGQLYIPIGLEHGFRSFEHVNPFARSTSPSDIIYNSQEEALIELQNKNQSILQNYTIPHRFFVGSMFPHWQGFSLASQPLNEEYRNALQREARKNIMCKIHRANEVFFTELFGNAKRFNSNQSPNDLGYPTYDEYKRANNKFWVITKTEKHLRIDENEYNTVRDPAFIQKLLLNQVNAPSYRDIIRKLKMNHRKHL